MVLDAALRLGSKIQLEPKKSFEELCAVPLKCESFGLVRVYVEK